MAKKTKKRKRKKNPVNNHSTLGAFIGSVVGGIPGHLITLAGARGLGAIVTELGWIGGGAAGGYYGATDDRKRRAALGGAVGGVFTPLGAALGGWVGGLKPDKQRNPAPWVLPAVIVGALAVGTTGAVLYVRRKNKKALGPGGGNKLTPGKPVRPGAEEPAVEWPPYATPIPASERDDWGYPKEDIRTREGNAPNGMPYRVYQSATEGTFYGAWDGTSDGEKEQGVVNWPYDDSGVPAEPLGIEQTVQATLNAIAEPYP